MNKINFSSIGDDWKWYMKHVCWNKKIHFTKVYCSMQRSELSKKLTSSEFWTFNVLCNHCLLSDNSINFVLLQKMMDYSDTRMKQLRSKFRKAWAIDHINKKNWKIWYINPYLAHKWSTGSVSWLLDHFTNNQ